MYTDTNRRAKKTEEKKKDQKRKRKRDKEKERIWNRYSLSLLVAISVN